MLRWIWPRERAHLQKGAFVLVRCTVCVGAGRIGDEHWPDHQQRKRRGEARGGDRRPGTKAACRSEKVACVHFFLAACFLPLCQLPHPRSISSHLISSHACIHTPRRLADGWILVLPLYYILHAPYLLAEWDFKLSSS